MEHTISVSFLFHFHQLNKYSTWLFFAPSFLSFIIIKWSWSTVCVDAERGLLLRTSGSFICQFAFCINSHSVQHYINCIYGKFSEACVHRICAHRCASRIVSSSPLCCTRQRDKTHLVHFDFESHCISAQERQAGRRCHCCRAPLQF